MANEGVNSYLKNRVLTASPEELRMMLYDGAIKFCTQARDAIGRKDYEGTYQGLVRAQKIVLELSTSLKHDIAPELCGKLSALYTYIYRLLVEASSQRLIKPVDEALELLQYERETWAMLMQQLGAEGRSGDGLDQATLSHRIENAPTPPQMPGDGMSSFSASA